MAPAPRSFTIRVKASRLAKGLLPIPRRFGQWFPAEQRQISIVFDDGTKLERKHYLPYDPKVKECRIFGLGRWFSRRKMKVGDLMTVTVDDHEKGVYRLALNRYVQERQETKTRQEFRRAESDTAARERLATLARITRKRLRRTAQQELLRIAEESAYQARGRVSVARSDRYEGVRPAVRVLLGALHQGRCQVCSFTFKKRDGEPYFEIHHIDPEYGHHPMNLLVICPNCHAQFEHANVTDFERVAGWLVAVKIDGKRARIRQPMSHEPLIRAASVLRMLLIAIHVWPLAFRTSRMIY